MRFLLSHFNLERENVDDILGGATAWKNVDETAAVCPSCSHREVYFMQMQLRSADEPMNFFIHLYSAGKKSKIW